MTARLPRLRRGHRAQSKLCARLQQPRSRLPSKGDYIHAVADVTKAGELTPKLRPWPAVVKAAPAKAKEVNAKPVSTAPGEGPAAEKAPIPTKAPVLTKAPVPTKAPVAEKPADDSWPAWARSKLAN